MSSSILGRISMRVAFSVALSCAAPVFCQAPAPTPSPSPSPGGTPGGSSPGGGIPGGGGQRPTRPTSPTPSQPQVDFEAMRPVFLSGKVVMDDGSRPPVNVMIERMCNGQSRPEGYADSKGHFSFQLGQSQNMMMDASQSGGPGGDMTGMGSRANMPGQMGGGISSRDLNGCEIRAVLAGFRSDVVMLAGRRSMDNPDIGTIVLHRLAKVEGFTFSGTSLNASKDARKAYEKGSEAAKKKKLDQAEKELRKAVELYPKYAVAWYELGTVYHQQNKLPEAREAYLSAMQADEKYVSPVVQVARIDGATAKWPETAEMSMKAIKLNPFFSPDVYYISAVANFNLQKFDIAEEHAREAAKMDEKQRNPRINNLLGMILAQKGTYPEAAENLRVFLKKVPEGPEAENVKKQLAEVERRMSTAASAAGTQAAQ